MAPGAHLLMSWLCSVPIFKQCRERRLVALAGISPDIDGIGIFIDQLSSNKTNFYFEYHHYLCHNIFASFVISLLATAFAKSQRAAVFCMSLFVIHIHFLCDILGSKGPDGYQWPIFYLYPSNKTFELTWSGQWELNAWQNQSIIFVLFILCFLVLTKKRMTFLEVISPRLESEAFEMWKKYFRKNT